MNCEYSAELSFGLRLYCALGVTALTELQGFERLAGNGRNRLPVDVNLNFGYGFEAMVTSSQEAS